MRQEKKYIKPDVEVIEFLGEDVILTSLIGEVGEDDPTEQPNGA